jgi:dipeptidyl aminopeptidase/acylaminoacyl peptidase
MPLSVAGVVRFGLLVLFAASMGAVLADAPAERPPIETFFDNAPFGAALLSPNARFLAIRVGLKGQRDGLAVMDLSTKDIMSVARFSDLDVGKFQWVNDQRLIFDTTDKQIGQGDVDRGPGLYAVNRDGSKFRQLAKRRGEGGIRVDPGIGKELLPWHTFLMPQPGAQDSDSIYVISPEILSRGNVSHVDLLHLNTVTGAAKAVRRPEATLSWLLDQRGEPRLATSGQRDMATVHYRDSASEDWRKLLSFKAYTGEAGAVRPLAFGQDGTLYVETAAGKDKTAVHRYDLATGKISDQPLVVITDYDFTGRLIVSNGRLLGMRVKTDAESTIWFDDKMKAVQKAIDSRLADTVNLISVAARPEMPWVLVEAYSDVLPKTFLLFNTETNTFSKVGDTHPGIKPAQMGRQEAVRYKARDGLEIPAWLTLPAGSVRKNLPLVVLVHGGPYVRGGSWGWRAESQFLASRGYAVLEPEFRGSTGFGHKHFKAGWKQWGLAMQDDIADGARWAIAEGIVDPKRICIAGTSYGGYSTLMGLVNDPDLYRCGVNAGGVTDINLLYTGHWSFQSDLSERFSKYGMPELVGDPVADAAQLKATSPLEQAARIKQPLLLAYGGADRRVPLYHGEKFYAAVKKTNPDVEWIEYPTEGHGWALPATRIDFWTRVEKFLDRNIGKP